MEILRNTRDPKDLETERCFITHMFIRLLLKLYSNILNKSYCYFLSLLADRQIESQITPHRLMVFPLKAILHKVFLAMHINSAPSHINWLQCNAIDIYLGIDMNKKNVSGEMYCFV